MMVWSTAASSGSTALRTLTFPVSSAVGSPPSPSSPPLHAAPTNRTIASSARTLDRCMATPPFPPILCRPYVSGAVNPWAFAPAQGSRSTHHLRVPARALLRRPSLGREVHVDQPESLRVPLGPLEVVEQGPDEEACQRNPRLERGVGGQHVLSDERDAFWVNHVPVRIHRAGERRAVLRDEDARGLVLAVEADEQLGETRRVDGPSPLPHPHTPR